MTDPASREERCPEPGCNGSGWVRSDGAHRCPRCASSSVSVDRDGAVEAAAKARFQNEELERRVRGDKDYEPEFPTWESLDAGRQQDYESEVADEVAAAAPLIVKAERERIERKVRLQGLVDPDPTDPWSNGWEAALDAALAVIDEKGDTDAR